MGARGTGSVIDRLVIIGVGLIGGSLARALRRSGAVGEIVGVGRSTANLEAAVELGVVDRFEFDAAEAVRGADMVVVAATLGASAAILETIGPVLDENTFVTDVGSTKLSVVTAARAALGARFPNFVPGHPIAGTEHSGVKASFAELFEDHKVILTPVSETREEALHAVASLWRATGASVVEMDVAHHDQVLAATSHLPHLLAYTLIDMLAAAEDSDEIFEFAAGGFRDFTRIASSNPEMWRDIILANREAVSQLCEVYADRFGALRRAIEAGDGGAIEAIFKRAKEVRDRSVISPHPSSRPAEDAVRPLKRGDGDQ